MFSCLCSTFTTSSGSLYKQVCLLQVDTNRDRLVSLEEFLKSTEKKEFSNPKEWEVKSPEVA